MGLQVFAQVGPYVAPYVGMATATMTTIGTSAISLGQYGLHQAYDAATAPKAKATIAAVGGAAIATIAQDWYLSDVKKDLANIKYALEHLQQHFPKMKELNITDREDTFKKIQDLSKEIREVEEQHESAAKLLTSVNERLSTIWGRCDPHVKDLMQKQGLAELTLAADKPESSAMQLASWVDATRQCHVDTFKYMKEVADLNKKVDECKLSKSQTKKKKDEAIEENQKNNQKVEMLSEIKGECKDMPKIEKKLEKCEAELKKAEKAERDCAVANAKLEPTPKSWTSTLTLGLFG